MYLYMTTELDIAIVGAGPAGAVTALCLARRHWRVGLFECGPLNRRRFGETLPPEVTPVLRRLGLWDGFLSHTPLESPGTIAAWGGGKPVEADFVGSAFGCGWHIDRNRFDEALRLEAIDAGASLHPNRRATWQRSAGVWQSEGFRARIVVNAAGRNELWPGRSDDREREDSLLAITLPISDVGPEWKEQRTLIETTSHGWWYSTLLQQRTGIAMFFTGAEIYRKYGVSIQEQLNASPLTRRHLNAGRIAAPEIVYAPSGRSRNIAGEDWLLVGDSASSYDPLSGRGIYKALRHGEAAAQAIDSRLQADTPSLETYAAKVTREFDEYSRQRKRFYSAERRWAEHPFWRARQAGREESSLVEIQANAEQIPSRHGAEPVR
jgi:flavin-dependent dehydrogenase